MKILLILEILLSALGGAAHAELPDLHELTLRSTITSSPEALTTERLWAIDPRERNPHRARWGVERKLSLPDLHSVSRSGRFGVSATTLLAQTVFYVRGAGPWFTDFKQFSCEAEPNSWFATEDGSGHAAKAAAESWVDEVNANKFKLGILLERIITDSEQRALDEAALAFRVWQDSVWADWAVRGRNQAHIEEWRYYLGTASSLKLCPRKKPISAPSWHTLVEQPPRDRHQKLLARAPARRWGGMYSIRVTVGFGDKTLDGQFLVDSGSAVSIVSPDWLKSQGINPALVELPGATPQRIAWTGGTGVAHRAIAFQTSVGGLQLPLTEFLLMQTELFTRPSVVTPCCDGVLGADFLKGYAVSLKPTSPPEVVIYDRQGYSQGSLDPWVEIANLPTGESVSTSCSLENSDGHEAIPAVRWDTGSEVAVDIHFPWQKSVHQERGIWNLVCGGKPIASDVPLSFPTSTHAGATGPFQTKMPGANVGMQLMGRGPFTFDMSHGRLWMDADGIAAKVPENRSGVEVKFTLGHDDERQLRIASLDPNKPAASLIRAGLKKGMLLTQIDSKRSEDLDLWEIERRLSGVYSKTVSFQWKTTTGQFKVAQLPLQ